MGIGKNEMEVLVLADGTVRVTTGSFAGPQHMSADQFMIFLQRELGGESKVTHGHSHAHGHDHAHDEEKAKG